MKKILKLKLLGADNKQINVFVSGIQTTKIDKSTLKVNGKTIKEIKEEVGYGDFKLIDFKIEEVVLKKLLTLPLSEEEKRSWFEEQQKELNYLYEKPLDSWDEYDESNWKSINR